MGKVQGEIDERLATWLQAQPVFFVATAPLAGDGLVNCSPKGGAGTFAIIGPRQVAYLDLTGSGIETIAHIRENGRIVLMFCAFEGKPSVVRLHGTGRAVLPEDPGFDDLAERFPSKPGIRSVIVVDLSRISDSCGYAVPTMSYVGDRHILDQYNEKKGEPALADYRNRKNVRSIDGLPGLD